MSRYARLMRLHKPIGIWLLLWPTMWALWIAGDGRPTELAFVVLVIGTIVARSAGCVINDYADRHFDGHVARTADRPIAAGEVAPSEALVLFVGLMFVALGLVLMLNRLTIVFACAGAAITIVYPFTKRFLVAPQSLLGIAFAWGVPMAFAAERGAVPRVGWLLFLAAVVWGVAYDTQYAMVDRDDDRRVGIKSTAIFLGDMDRAFVAGLQVILLFTLALVGVNVELGVWFYAGLALGAVLAAYQLYLIKQRDREQCFAAFMNNAWFGGCVFAGIALDYLFNPGA
jgi:4-hydroxybenzoate polyprenyltransferase